MCGVTNSKPAALTNPATVASAVMWRKLRREQDSFKTLGCRPQKEEDSGIKSCFISFSALRESGREIPNPLSLGDCVFGLHGT
jgi:hypothetical protein